MLNKAFFKRMNLLTLVSVFLLILVGSIVRSLGAGMGCPDWPKCFGDYVPPSSEEKLPANYKEIFKNERIEKNARVARLFASMGYSRLSERIMNDPNISIEHDFDITKAWIEYVNRLIGVLIGLFVFINMIASFSFRKTDNKIVIAGVLIFLLTGFQGWIGSLVVSSNLLDGFITFHMGLALLILALLIWQWQRSKYVPKAKHNLLYFLTGILFIIFLPQVILGTDVRAIVDDYLFFNIDRESWYEGLVGVFYIHRSYSWIILLGSIAILYIINRDDVSTLRVPGVLLLVLVITAMLAGIGMVKFEFPFWLQPLHMICATGIFATLFYLLLQFKVRNE